jgi:hypothetical protein
LVVICSIDSVTAILSAYADHASRRIQLGIGAVILIVADMVLVTANTTWWTALGIYEVAIGVTAFGASARAGVIWMVGGPAAAFVVGACIAASARVLLLLRPLPGGVSASS